MEREGEEREREGGREVGVGGRIERKGDGGEKETEGMR